MDEQSFAEDLGAELQWQIRCGEISEKSGCGLKEVLTLELLGRKLESILGLTHSHSNVLLFFLGWAEAMY